MVDMIVFTLVAFFGVCGQSSCDAGLPLVFFFHNAQNVLIREVLLLQRAAVPAPSHARHTANLAEKYFSTLIVQERKGLSTRYIALCGVLYVRMMYLSIKEDARFRRVVGNWIPVRIHNSFQLS